jgi:hypothetical protein
MDIKKEQPDTASTAERHVPLHTFSTAPSKGETTGKTLALLAKKTPVMHKLKTHYKQTH